MGRAAFAAKLRCGHSARIPRQQSSRLSQLLNYRCNNPLFFSVRTWYFSTTMNLPHWVDKEISMLPDGFNGQILIECYRGGVSRIETKTSRQAPTTVEPVRHVLSA